MFPAGVEVDHPEYESDLLVGLESYIIQYGFFPQYT